MTPHKAKIYGIIEDNFRSDYDNLLRMAENKLGNIWGEDAVMDTYASVIKAASRLHAQYDIKYLMRAALYNRIKDYMSDRVDTEEIEEEHIYGGCVEDKWKNIDSARKAIDIINRAKEPMRTALYLACLEGVGVREVSSITEIPVRTINHHLLALRTKVDA